MNATQKLRHKILLVAASQNTDIVLAPGMTGDDVDEIFEGSDFEDDIHDAEHVVREGEVATEIRSDYSRHYESRSVAAKMADGSWVGWTYWFGGGKHGEPESIEWIEDAYQLSCVEEQKMVTIQTFTKVEEAQP